MSCLFGVFFQSMKFGGDNAATRNRFERAVASREPAVEIHYPARGVEREGERLEDRANLDVDSTELIPCCRRQVLGPLFPGFRLS